MLLFRTLARRIRDRFTPKPPTFQDWLARRADRAPGFRTAEVWLYADYHAVMLAGGVEPLDRIAFAQALAAEGLYFAGKDRLGRRVRRGLRLKPAPMVDWSAPRSARRGLSGSPVSEAAIEFASRSR
jgi:hypothetical protein